MRVRVRVMVPVLVLQLLFIVAPSAFAARHRAAAPSSPVTEYEGVIKTAAAGSIVVTTSHKVDVTFSITTTTVIRHGETAVDPSKLAAGDQVHVKATSSDNVNTAVLILVQQQASDDTGGDDPPNAVTANGYVTSVAADSIVVHRAEGTDVTVKVTDGTSIKKYGQTIHLADIKVGDHVEALGTAVDPTTIAALQIEVENGNPSEDKPHHH